MILVHRHPFGISRWHKDRLNRAPSSHEKGLVLSVKVRFGSWLGGEEVEADAFLDPGADSTIVSWRWAAEARKKLDWRQALDTKNGLIREDMFVLLGEQSLKVPASSDGPEIRNQSVRDPHAGDMPGFEDILLGRDFLSAHKLLVVVDGDEPSFSILLPGDEDNVKTRAAVRDALKRDHRGGGEAPGQEK